MHLKAKWKKKKRSAVGRKHIAILDYNKDKETISRVVIQDAQKNHVYRWNEQQFHRMEKIMENLTVLSFFFSPTWPIIFQLFIESRKPKSCYGVSSSFSGYRATTQS